MKHINKQEMEEIFELYNAGASVKDLAETYDCSPSTIYDKLAFPVSYEDKKHINIKKIIKDFESGKTRWELAAEYGYSYNYICTIIKENCSNQEIVNRKSSPLSSKKLKETVKYHEDGLTDTEIAKIYGCSKQNINEKLQRYYKNKNKEKENNDRRLKITIKDIKTRKYENMTIEEIASLFHVSFNNTLYKINLLCKKNNLNRTDYIKTNYEKELFNRHNKIVELYEFGYSQEKIAEICNTKQSNIGRILNDFYKKQNKKQPVFLMQSKINHLIKQKKEIKEIEQLAQKEGKIAPTKKMIDALKQYRQDLYLYYLDKENINRYKLEDGIEKEHQKLKKKNK